MDDVADGVVEVTFGVMLTVGHYEARRGQLEFRGGRLVGLWLGRHEPSSEGGLTVGVTLFPAPPGYGHGRERPPCSCGHLHLLPRRPRQ
jgi:hypothetical protein